MGRRKWSWTDFQVDKLNKAQDILEEWKAYKPLTLRQIHYQFVSKGFIKNTVSQYGMLSRLLKWARINGYIAWEDIEDRVRAFHDLTGWDNKDSFIKASLNTFLKGYDRDLMQSQEKYIEIWIEKDALSSIFTKIASKYTVPVVVCKGFNSISFQHDYAERLNAHNGKTPILLYFGDFDPSGMAMLPAIKTTLEDELEIIGIEYKRVALLKEDIFKYKLPHSFEAIKKGDTRAKKHIVLYGMLAVEVDALRPDILEDKIKTAIEDEIDIEAFNKEVVKHNAEIDKINQLREKVKKFISGQKEI